MRVVRRSLVALSVAGALGAALLMTASVLSYHNLTAETLVAEVTFDRVADQQYVAHLRTANGCEERTLEVFGDQWRIDAAFLKWKYWASALGLDAQYKLERFEGRYREAADQNTRPKLAHEIGDTTAVDVATLAKGLGPLNFLVDASYGSSTYQDIDTNRVFDVYRSTTGILTRSVPRRAAIAEPGNALEIEIKRACAEQAGVWASAARWADGAVRGFVASAGGA